MRLLRVVLVVQAIYFAAPIITAQNMELHVEFHPLGCELIPGFNYDCFKVFMRPTENYSNPIQMGGSQITIVTPTANNTAFTQIQNNNGGTWSDAQIGCDGSNCFHAFSNTAAPINMSLNAGQELQLFTFATPFPGSCIDDVRLHNMGVDPSDPGDGGDYNISIQINPFGEVYLGNYDNAPIDCSALPIEFISFTARKSGPTAILRWTTTAETNNAYFGVQRSINGGDFVEIGKVPGAGTFAGVLNYEHVDDKPGRGSNYYRVLQVDYDGKSSATNIEVVRFDDSTLSSTFRVYPNPSSEGLHVYLPEEQIGSQSEIEMYNSLGQAVFSQQVAEGSGYEFIDYSKTGIISGIYSLRILTNREEVSRETIIVQK